MKIIALPSPSLHDYLMHVFDSYIRRGIPSDELAVAAETYRHLANAREIPIEENLGKATITEAGPHGVALEFEEGADSTK